MANSGPRFLKEAVVAGTRKGSLCPLLRVLIRVQIEMAFLNTTLLKALSIDLQNKRKYLMVAVVTSFIEN